MFKIRYNSDNTRSSIRNFLNGEFHCLDERPAVEQDGDKFWLKHGNYHRKDGPACEYSNGVNKWYLNGVEFTKEKWWEMVRTF